MTGPLAAGERVLLIDARGRRFLIMLQDGGAFHFHGGVVAHDDVIGRPEGSRIESRSGSALTAFRPRLADFVVKMSRGAQVVYPKDLGAILVQADVFPGAHVLEAGTGSAALTIALCRATGPEGRVVTYEVRDDHREVAARNVDAFFGEAPAWLELRAGDVREIAETGESFHRAILDLPEPWEGLAEVTAALDPGGILCGYLPTTPQVQSLVVAMIEGGYLEIETLEVLQRGWHVTPRSVRPDHRMVAHTGFLVVGRRAGGG